MPTRPWIRRLQAAFRRHHRRSTRRRVPQGTTWQGDTTFLPAVEVLEDRTLLTTLTDFGYAAGLTDDIDADGVLEAIPAIGTRPLLGIMAQYQGDSFSSDHTSSYYQQMLFGPEYLNVQDYFQSVSGDRFQWSTAGVVGPVSVSKQYTDLSDQQQLREAIDAASRNGFNFAAFDTNSDGLVDQTELTIVVVAGDQSDAKVRWIGRFRPAGATVDVAGWGAILDEDQNFLTFVHEISHLLGTGDIYGRWNQDAFSISLSLMSATIGVGPADDVNTSMVEGLTFDLDPWHKLRMGWTRPQLVNVSALSFGGDLVSLQDGPILLYDEARGTDEFFLIEKRPGGIYDADATAATIPLDGVAVWYVNTQDGGLGLPQMKSIPSIEDPDTLINANFALDHMGTHVGDPGAIASRGLASAGHLPPQSRLWRDGDFRLRWRDRTDVRVRLEILNPGPNRWSVRVHANSSPIMGGRLSQSFLHQPHVDDLFGSSMVAVDFNRDGYMDLAIGAPGDASPSGARSGAVYVYHGSAVGLELSTILRQGGLGSDEAGDQFGFALAAGDYNGDGFPDLAVGAPGEAPGGDPQSGAVYLFRGLLGGMVGEAALTQTGVGVSGGNEDGDRFGSALAFGDFDGDGFDDLAVGAPGESQQLGLVESGAIYVFSGSSSALVPGYGRTRGDQRGGDHFGAALVAADFTGDDVADLAVGAPDKVRFDLTDRPGRVYLYTRVGNTLSARQTLDQSSGDTDENGDEFGRSLAAADFNNDGIVDLAVGAPGEAIEMLDNMGAVVSRLPNVGAVSTFFGSTSTTNPLQTGQFLQQGGLSGDEAGDRFGEVLAAGDFTGDGIADLSAGAPGEVWWENAQSGAAYLFRAAARSGRAEFIPERAISQSGLGGINLAPDQTGDLFGTALAIGDFNRDGVGDVAVGAPRDFTFEQQPDGSILFLAGGGTYYYAGLGDLRVLDDVHGTPNDETWYVHSDSTGTFLLIWEGDAPNGRPNYAVSRDVMQGNVLTFNGNGGDDRLIVDVSNGSPFEGLIEFIGGSGQGDKLEVRGSNDEDTILVTTEFVIANTTGVRYREVEELNIEARGDDDTINIDATPIGTITTIDGNGGVDRFFVGGRNYLTNILGGVTINGDDGADELTIDDTAAEAGIRLVEGEFGPLPFTIQDTYTLTSNTFRKRTTTGLFEPTDPVDSPLLRFSSMADVTLNASGSTGEDFPEAFSSIILVESVSSAVALNVNARGGSDQIIISNEARDLDTIRGRVDVDGGTGRDSLILRDQDGTSSLFGLPVMFSSGLITRTLISDPLVPYGKFAGVEFSSAAVEYRASGAGDVLLVESTAPNSQLEIFAGGGDDLVVFSSADGNLDSIRGAVTVHGGGVGRLAFNDRNGVGVIAPPYTITSTQVTRPIIPDPFPFSKFAGVSYDGMNSLTFSASELPDIILVESTSANTPVEIRGNGGADQIVLTNGSKRLDDIQGRVTVKGGDSFDQVFLSDQNGIPSAVLPFTFRDGLVARPILPPQSGFGQFAGLAYDGELEQVEFRASEGPDILLVESTTPESTLKLRGNGGVDQFFVLAPPSSLVDIDGGDPTAAPGDRLTLRGTGTETDGEYVNDPENPSGGWISIGGQEVVHFTNLEPVTVINFARFTFVSGGSRDDIIVDGPEADRSRVSGTSDGVSFENLTFYDVPEVVLDLARNDGADPDDRVLIESGGLGASGLQNFTILTGAGESDVTILDSTVPVTVISDEGVTQALIVSNTNDGGPGSLRAAIEAANALVPDGTAAITFAIPATDPGYIDVDAQLVGGDAEPDVFVISPLTALPALTRGQTVVNGQSQHSLTGDTNPFGPEIVLAGNLAGVDVDGLHLASINNHVHGLNIQQFSNNGVLISANGNTLTGNYIGTNATGGVPGDALFDNTSITTTVSASVSTANGRDGVRIVESSGNLIGGTTDAARNVISGNADNGITVEGGAPFPSLNGSWQADGNATDSTGDNDGNIFGAGFTSGARGGQAFQFDGVDDYVQVPNSPNFESQSITVSAWVNSTDRNGAVDYFVAKGGLFTVAASYALYQRDGTVFFYIFDGTSFYQSPGVSADAIYDGQWHHLTGSYDGQHVRLYVDGAEVGNGTARTASIGYGLESSNDLFIGNYIDAYNGGTFNFAGAIDDVVLFDEALTAQQVATLHAAGSLVGGGNTIQGNYIGTTADGLSRLGNSNAGVYLDNSSGNMIGGLSPEACNVVSGNDGEGILIRGSSADSNVIQGNFVGLNATGSDAIGNRLSGIFVPGATNTQILDNVVSGNLGFAGIAIYGGDASGGDASGTVIWGNYVGTNASGDAPLPNLGRGVSLHETDAALIGGTTNATRNIISGNLGDGVTIFGGFENVVQGNYIGTTADGMSALGNGTNGVSIDNGSDNLIGGFDTEARNVISANAGGVSIVGPLAMGNRVAGNYIGVGVDGQTPLGNGHGVAVVGTAAGNLIGGTDERARNVISASVNANVLLAGTLGTTVQGNYIGTDATGTLPTIYAQQGIRLADDRDSLIGGTEPGAGNVVSGNFDGIYVSGSTSTGGGTQRLRIQGNRIGTTADGQDWLPNFVGLYVDGFESETLHFETHDVLIGGVEQGAGNVISANQNGGIIIRGPNLTGIKIQGNKIGTDIDGIDALPNGINVVNSPGVLLQNVTGVLVGGTEAGAGNVVSGNNGAGVSIVGGGDHTLQRNLIGLASDAITPLGNGGIGVQIRGGASNNLIGTTGTDPSQDMQGNVIAHNAQQGVAIVDADSLGNTIRGNSIYSNGGLSIDLGGEGVTPNDALDADSGPNLLQNIPELSNVKAGVETQLVGKLKSTPNSAFIVDFYASSADPSGFGEGKRWLGSILVVSNGEGTASFNVTLLAATIDGEFITATATDASGNTSEFSEAIVSGKVKKVKKGGIPDSQVATEASASSQTVPADSSQISVLDAVFLIWPSNRDPDEAAETPLIGNRRRD